MPDIYASITAADAATLERLAGALELRAADLLRRGILNEFVSQITFPKEAKVLEIGCGTGGVTRFLARLPDVSHAVGIDPSPLFIAKAKELGGSVQNLRFQEGDGTVQNVLRFIERPSQAGTQSRYNDAPLRKLILRSSLPRSCLRGLKCLVRDLNHLLGCVGPVGRSERHLGRTYGLAVLLSGSLGGFKPGSCYLKKDFALSLGVGSPGPTETFLRILVILPS